MRNLRGMVFLSSLLLFASLGFLSCQGCETKPVPKTCTKVFAQCQLPKGPIGICQHTTCKAGQKKPCFACVSQH